MKFKLFLITLFLSVLLFSACSTREDFVVVNKSNGSIEVQYKLKRCTPDTPGAYVSINPPAKLSIKDFQKSDHVWNNLASEQYKFDNSSCEFTVIVAPNEALLVDFTYNYRGHNSENSEVHFDIESLSITGEKGAMRFEGRQAQTQFKVESGDYILIYE